MQHQEGASPSSTRRHHKSINMYSVPHRKHNLQDVRAELPARVHDRRLQPSPGEGCFGTRSLVTSAGRFAGDNPLLPLPGHLLPVVPLLGPTASPPVTSPQARQQLAGSLLAGSSSAAAPFPVAQARQQLPDGLASSPAAASLPFSG
ncbi:hypothetical protein ACLB2K_008060 [Fragaria x ananassa]